MHGGHETATTGGATWQCYIYVCEGEEREGDRLPRASGATRARHAYIPRPHVMLLHSLALTVRSPDT